MPTITSTNPSRSYQSLGEIEITTQEALHTIIESAKKAQKSWRNTSIAQRVSLLSETYHLFDRAREDITISIAQEMGMPIRQARDEVQYGMTYWKWYLENAEKYLSPEIARERDTELHTVYYEPKGVVAAIAPWNYPFSMFVWTCIQALLAGNAVIFKNSKDVILTGKLISEIMEKSPLPDGVWTEVFGSGELGDTLANANIDFITFTGSTRVGRGLAQIAAEKGIGCVMELGGSAPGIVMDDADIDSVIDTIYFLRYSNSGQMCDGLKRLIVHKSRYNDVVTKLKTIILSKTIGDASQESTDIGPLVSKTQLDHLEEQYRDALDKGAEILVEGKISEDLNGAYFPPMLIGNISFDMKIWKEEVFGLILPIVTFETMEEAIELANDTEYGLGAYIFTKSVDTFRKIASKIDSGMVQMNNLNYCIPENPFGGYKNSGIGREHGRWGFHEFTNIKVTSIPKK